MAHGRLEMDEGKGGEVNGMTKMRRSRRDESMCRRNMDDQTVRERIGFSDSCWESCHIKLEDEDIFFLKV